MSNIEKPEFNLPTSGNSFINGKYLEILNRYQFVLGSNLSGLLSSKELPDMIKFDLSEIRLPLAAST